MRRFVVGVALIALTAAMPTPVPGSVIVPVDQVVFAGITALPHLEEFPVDAPPFVVPTGGHRDERVRRDGATVVTLRLSGNEVYAERVYAPESDQWLRTTYNLADGQQLIFTALPFPQADTHAATEGPTSTALLATNKTQTHDESYLASHITCGSNLRNPYPWRIIGSFGWRWNQNSTPVELDLSNTLTALRNARINWESNQNHCNFPDSVDVDFTYQGTTTATYGDNGVNTVGWGDVDVTGCGNVLACTRFEVNNGQVVESDTRMEANDSARWHNGAVPGEWDVESVFTHESGHTAGFDDVVNASSLVMYFDLDTGDISGRKLGRGDSSGATEKY